MRDIKELVVLSKDFVKFVSGKDYSRQPQPLGKYFTDPRCYYNDLRGKALWTGAEIDGVPALKFASTGELFLFPIDIFLYGLGSIDKFFFDQDHSVVNNVKRVAQWMMRDIMPNGAYDEQWSRMSPHAEFYSNNSGMGQGLALSFAIRVVKYDMVDPRTRNALAEVITRIKNNMLLPVEQGGTRLDTERGTFLMEFPRKDGNVVLNGWIFGVFGLYDYINYQDDAEVRGLFNTTLKTMTEMLPDYHLPSGWAYYDNMQRICSPFYQDLHIALLDAMYRITGIPEFAAFCTKAKSANSVLNRSKFTVSKIMEKLFKDNEAYSSV